MSALTQFGEISAHPELGSGKLILLGFSGTGSLAGQRRQLTGSVGPFLVIGDTGPLKIVLSEETYRERKFRDTR